MCNIDVANEACVQDESHSAVQRDQTLLGCESAEQTELDLFHVLPSKLMPQSRQQSENGVGNPDRSTEPSEWSSSQRVSQQAHLEQSLPFATILIPDSRPTHGTSLRKGFLDGKQAKPKSQPLLRTTQVC